MNLAHRPTKILVTGKSGSGKSTFATRYLLNAPHQFQWIFDHEGEFSQRCQVPAITTLDDLALAFDEGQQWIIFDPSEAFEGNLAGAFDFFCETCFEVGKNLAGTKLFSCDELQKLVGTNQITPSLAKVIETGRRYEIDTLFVSQQPNLIHNRVRNQVTEVVSFSQVDASAMDMLEDLGFSPEELRDLKVGDYVARRFADDLTQRGNIFTSQRPGP